MAVRALSRACGRCRCSRADAVKACLGFSRDAVAMLVGLEPGRVCALVLPVFLGAS